MQLSEKDDRISFISHIREPFFIPEINQTFFFLNKKIIHLLTSDQGNRNLFWLYFPGH